MEDWLCQITSLNIIETKQQQKLLSYEPRFILKFKCIFRLLRTEIVHKPSY